MKLTPVASMRMSTWPGPGCGIGRSTSLSTSGPPVSWIWMAFMSGQGCTLRGDQRKGLEVAVAIFGEDAGLFGSAQAHEAIDGVGRAMLRGVIVAHLQLAEQADGEHLDAGDDEHSADNEERTVLIHHVLVRIEDLEGEQDGGDDGAGDDAQSAEAAEEMQRAAHVAEQEADGEQIEEDAEGAADAVVALAALAIHVLDRDFADGRAIPRGERGNEAVHLAVERDVLDDFAAIGLEGSAEVVDVDAGEPGHEPVGAARRNAAHDEVVNAILAPAGNDVVAFLEFLEEAGNLIGIVLQIAVHGEDELA